MAPPVARRRSSGPGHACRPPASRRRTAGMPNPARAAPAGRGSGTQAESCRAPPGLRMAARPVTPPGRRSVRVGLPERPGVLTSSSVTARPGIRMTRTRRRRPRAGADNVRAVQRRYPPGRRARRRTGPARPRHRSSPRRGCHCHVVAVDRSGEYTGPERHPEMRRPAGNGRRAAGHRRAGRDVGMHRSAILAGASMKPRFVPTQCVLTSLC